MVENRQTHTEFLLVYVDTTFKEVESNFPFSKCWLLITTFFQRVLHGGRGQGIFIAVKADKHYLKSTLLSAVDSLQPWYDVIQMEIFLSAFPLQNT